MRGWLKWGRVAKPGAVNVPFRRSCRCGHVADVLRTSQHQRLTCSACGEAGFVLPRDAYPGPGPVPIDQSPDPPSRATPTTSRSGRARPATKPPREIATNSPSTAAAAVSEPPPKRPPADPLVTRTGIQAESVHTPRRRLLTPFRLVGGCMLLIVGATVWWGVQRAQLASDAGRLNDLTRGGMESLAAGDFVSAARDLGVAADVLRRLGRDDPAALLIRQRGREAQAATGLVSVSLIEILRAADRCVGDRSPDAWDRQFEREFEGGWIIMQSPLEAPITEPRDPETLDDSGDKGQGEDDGGGDERETVSEVGAFSVEYPFAVGKRGVHLVGQLPELVRLPSWQGDYDSSPVIFAAQLESCRLDPRTDTWRLQLKTGSIFLWTDSDSLKHLGFLSDLLTDDSEIQALLDNQAGAVGLVVEKRPASDGDEETRPRPAADGDEQPRRESAE